MGKTGDLFKKIGDTKGTFHTKTGTIKDRNGTGLTKEEVARIHRRTVKKKTGLNNLDNHNSVITHLKPDILECKVKWALGSNSTNSGGDGIPAELFQILQDGAVKVLHSRCQQLWKPWQ